MHSGDFMSAKADEPSGASRAKGGIRTRMQHYFQKQKHAAPALSAVR